MPDALQLAIETGETVYDCLYLATAICNRCLLVTADGRFAKACRATPFAGHIRMLRELA